MSSGAIGIKLADNRFFPVMDDSIRGSKTLELITARENQESVKIHLYHSKENSKDQTIENAEHIGTLTLSDITEDQAGYSTIKLRISLNDLGNLLAEAIDENTGTSQSINISIENLLSKDLEESFDSNFFDFHDFDNLGLEVKDYKDSENDAEALVKTPANDFIENSKSRDFSSFTQTTFQDAFKPKKPVVSEPNSANDLGSVKKTKKRKGSFFPMGLLSVIILLAGSLALLTVGIFAWETFYGGELPSLFTFIPAYTDTTTQPLPASASDEGALYSQADPPPPVWQENSAAIAAAPGAPKALKTFSESQDARYRVRWGDTLWNIAETYYRNPWQYSSIAQHNGISNPNHIIAGTDILIPAE